MRPAPSTPPRAADVGKALGAAVLSVALLPVLGVLLQVAGLLPCSAQSDEARVARTHATLRTIEDALERYRATRGSYPPADRGLHPLVSQGLLLKPPLDGFGNDLDYFLVDGRPRVVSYGKDGLPGGDGPGADLLSEGPEARAFRHTGEALLAMKRDAMRFPSEAEGLALLVERGFLPALPRDPWGHPLHYQLRDGYPVLRSLGADGAAGGTGPDADSEHVVPERGLGPPF